MARAIFFCVLVLAVLSGCKKNIDQNSSAHGTGKIEMQKGSNQSGIFGEVLKDTIVLKVSSRNPGDHFIIRYALSQGMAALKPMTDTGLQLTMIKTVQALSGSTGAWDVIIRFKKLFSMFTDSAGGLYYHH
jgi:hypothetical protein